MIGFGTPSILALVFNILPHTEIPVLEAAKGVTLMITFGEVGWIGGGVIIEGGKILKKAVTTMISSGNTTH